MLKPIDVILLFENHPEQLLKAGEILFREGDPGEVMYGILSGEIEMTLRGKVVETLSPGDALGERALVHEDHRRFCTAIAKTEAKVAVMDRERFLFAVQQTPMFALELLRSYSERACKLKEHLRQRLD